jgi:hypothetical protein
MSQVIASAPFRNAASNDRSSKHIAALRAAIAALEPAGARAELDTATAEEARVLIEAMIVLLSVDEHFVYRLTNAAAGLR